MTKDIEGQIRRYTEDLYAQATPVDRLAADAVGGESDRIHRLEERDAAVRVGRSLSGPAVAMIAAVGALLAVIPLWLLAGGRDTPTIETTNPAPVASGSLDAFAGTWIGFDELDGSTNILTIDGVTNRVVYEETDATACRDPFGEIVSGSVAGSATVDGDRLEFVGTFYCDLEAGREAVPFFEDFVWVVEYDAESDTLSLAADPATLLHRSDDP